ncbi:MAG: nuclear transport factor 2 family protein [Actinomycetia bacterium]|nr:nuclear transport factor 2 family protein [Actinomycetes bacterium]
MYIVGPVTHWCPADDDAAIRNVLGLTAFLGDQGAPEDYRKVYAPDVVWRMGEHVQSGADEIVAAAAARRAEGVSGPGTGTRHLVIPLTIEVAGETATAVSYYVFLSGTTIATTGTYHDELARTGHGWQITRRDITAG